MSKMKVMHVETRQNSIEVDDICKREVIHKDARLFDIQEMYREIEQTINEV